MLSLIAVLLIGCSLILPTEALAYVDPNTGGYIFQILGPIFFAILGMLVIFYQKTINMIKKTFYFFIRIFHKSNG